VNAGDEDDTAQREPAIAGSFFSPKRAPCDCEECAASSLRGAGKGNVMPRASFVVLGIVGSAVLALVGAAPAQEDAKGRTTLGLIEIKGKPLNRPPELAYLFGQGEEVTLRQLVDAVRDAAGDDDIGGLVLRLKDAELKPSQVEELGAAIGRYRQSGKKVYLFSESFGTGDFLLAAHCDRVLGQKGGPVSLPGLYMEEMFLADTLAWAGVRADFVQVGDYKGASEALARNAPSPQWDQNINQLLDSMYANVRGPIMEGRNLSGQELDRAMEDLWFGQVEEAAAAGLIDSAIDLPELSGVMREEYGGAVAWDSDIIETGGGQMDAANPFALFAILSKKPDHDADGPTIAVVHIDGPIVDGESSAGGLMGSASVGSRTIRNALEDVRKDDDIKGVVLRIDSPGGSATASEIIWQGVQRVREKKPVWVSVGSMAASGGYYCAVAGERIYVNPSSIVGSIGVVGGKLTLDGLYDRLRVNVVGRGRGPRAGMFASGDGWDEREKNEVREKMTRTYDLFTRRVTEGRPGIDLSRTAEGRLFTGDKAVGLAMADEVGGLSEAITELAARLDLDEYGVMDFPAPRSLQEIMQEALGGMANARAPGAAGPALSPLAQAARAALGDDVFGQVAPQVDALVRMREQRVMLVSPRLLIWK